MIKQKRQTILVDASLTILPPTCYGYVTAITFCNNRRNFYMYGRGAREAKHDQKFETTYIIYC